MKDTVILSKDIISKILEEHNLDPFSSYEEYVVGTINPIFVINSKYVLRINTKNTNESKLKFERESFLYKTLHNSGILTPECIAYDTSHLIIDYDYLILSYIPGQTLTTAFEDCDISTKSNLSYELGAIVHKIHSVDLRALSSRPELFDSVKNWASTMNAEFLVYFDYIKSNNLLPLGLIEGIELNSKQYLAIPDLHRHYSLIHGDFSRDNIQVLNRHIVGIFDFEMAQIGDPLYDLQKLPIKFQLGIGFDRNAFLAGYSMPTMSREEKIRLNRYAITQGVWEIWATATKAFNYAEKEMAEGRELIINAI